MKMKLFVTVLMSISVASCVSAQERTVRNLIEEGKVIIKDKNGCRVITKSNPQGIPGCDANIKEGFIIEELDIVYQYEDKNTHLKISIDDTDITSLEGLDELAQAPNVVEISITYNNFLKKIPRNSFRNFINLRKLYVFGTPLEVIEVEAFSNRPLRKL